jgi:hypothetical protein
VSIYTHIPHPRIQQRKAEGPVKTADQLPSSSNRIVRFNNWSALKITAIVGTMWCAYAFTTIALVSLPAALGTGQLIVIIAWIAQTFLQLVLLPIIIVGQNVQAAAADARSQATYDDAAAVLEEAKQIQAHLAAQDAAIEKILGAISPKST